ncbi:MAG TPA: hypothetical protein DCM73_11165 [Clostridiales bacterium]|nr:hypothetical protein [Clostridiales bacterium]
MKVKFIIILMLLTLITGCFSNSISSDEEKVSDDSIGKNTTEEKEVKSKMKTPFRIQEMVIQKN